MKNAPKIVAGMLIACIFASGNYWFKHFSGGSTLPVGEIVAQTEILPRISAARSLFGNRVEIVADRQYQLNGVVFSGAVAERIAIISVNSKPANVVKNGGQVDPGVTLKEVNRVYVVLSDERGEMRVAFPKTDIVLDASAMANQPLMPATAANQAPHADQRGKVIEHADMNVTTRPAPPGMSRPDAVLSVPGVLRPAPPARAS